MTKPLIHIVGPANSQNESLVELLETKMDADCLHTPEPDHSCTTTAPRYLVFWDSRGASLRGLWNWLALRKEKRLSLPLVVLFNLSPDAPVEKNIVRQGVRGVFFDNASPDMILKGVLGVLEGKLWFSRDIMTTLLLEQARVVAPVKNTMDSLTVREKEILVHIASGDNNSKIADELCISSHTVKSHIYSVFKKISVTGRLEAALWAGKNL